MINHNYISVFKTPKVWFKDKVQTVLKQRQIYFISSLPGIFVIIGLVADLKSILNYSKETFIILLLCYLFIFGLLNLWFVTLIQRIGVKLQRQKSTAKIMHKVLSEGIREYLTYKRMQNKDNKPIELSEVKKHIYEILTAFNDQYLSIYYRHNITITIKYLSNNYLYPFRVGDNIIRRSQVAEHYDNSFVYQALTKSGNKLTYLYVKNLA